MNFYGTPRYKNEIEVKRQLQKVFNKDDDGFVICQYPIYANGSNRFAIDFLIIHRQYGLWIFESKGLRLGNIVSICGTQWNLDGFYKDKLDPLDQIEQHRYALKNRVIDNIESLKELDLHIHYRLTLPFINRDEWQSSEFSNNPCANEPILFSDDLYTDTLRSVFEKTNHKKFMGLSEDQWHDLQNSLISISPVTKTSVSQVKSCQMNFRTIINSVRRKTAILDDVQKRIVWDIPDGAQRIRGLAGTGKTILFARRAAILHTHHPKQDIIFTFYTKNLRQLTSQLVNYFYKQLNGTAADLTKLKILHAWGGKHEDGLYKLMCEEWGIERRTLSDMSFEDACNEAEASLSEDAQPFIDAIFIDEAQDIPPSFFRLAFKALREPKRLYWAYDEAQGIGSLIVPSSIEIFGKNSDGSPVLDLGGFDHQGISKSLNLNCCYRTPKNILTMAHAVNMGLYRKDGIIQGVSTAKDWNDLGYTLISGDFSQSSVKQKKHITIKRKDSLSRHPTDSMEESEIELTTLFNLVKYVKKYEMLEQLTTSISDDLESGIQGHEIMIINFAVNTPYNIEISKKLKTNGIKSHVVQKKTKFKIEDSISISNIYVAKGNEAIKVYIVGLGTTKSEYNNLDEELLIRNQLFTALTRTKLWCVLYIKECELAEELSKIWQNCPEIKFLSFNKSSLKRHFEEQEQLTIFEEF